MRHHLRKFGQRVQALRLQHELTQEDAAREIGLSRKQLVRIEAGEANLTFASMIAIAKAYGVEVWELLMPEVQGK